MDERAGARPEGGLPHHDLQFPLQHPKGLVLAVVDVRRRTTSRGHHRVGERVRPAGVFARRLEKVISSSATQSVLPSSAATCSVPPLVGPGSDIAVTPPYTELPLPLRALPRTLHGAICKDSMHLRRLIHEVRRETV